MALVMGVVCDKEGEGMDGGQVMATRAMATMWAVAVTAAVMVVAAAALLMMFPVSNFLFSIFLPRSPENNTVCLFWLECPTRM
jgi:hypothetical protein